jgi:hypothetical protein
MKWMLASVLSCLVGMVLLPAALIAEAAPATTIESITHRPDEAGKETILIHCDRRVEPKIFRINGDLPRVVIDFPDAIYRGSSTITPDSGTIVQRIRTAVHRDPTLKTRVVFDLTHDGKVTFSRATLDDDKVLEITLQMVAVEANSVVASATPQPSAPAAETGQAASTAAVTEKPPLAGIVTEKAAPAQPPEVTDTVAPSAVVTNTVVKEAASPAPVSATPPGEGEKKSTAAAFAAKHMDEKPVPPVFTKSKPAAMGEPESVKPSRAQLLEISFDDSSNRGEMVLFHLNDFYPPLVSAIEKDNPRVLCDFMNMQLGPAVQETIVANGRYVEQIHAAHHDNPSKVRVVLDLSPDRDYDLQQVFFKHDNLFVLIVNELSPKNDAVK